MGEMMDAQDKLQALYDADQQDSATINKQYKVIEDLRLQMVDNSVEAHNRINSILTKEQREKAQNWGGRGYGP
jgi:Spy/CpxP family protein refolding chaperone